jgi:hypothetical protein
LNIDFVGVLVERPNRRRIARAAGALFLTMLTWAFASPLGSTSDEWFHLGSIWCANGVDGTDCLDFNEPGESGFYSGVAAIEDGSCFLDNAAEYVRCETAVAEPYPSNFGLYPSSFYRVMNLFVTSHPTLSVLAMRLVNGLIAVALFVGVLMLSNSRARMAWLTGYIFTILPMTLYLTASIHPSGWAVTGTSTSWLFLHSAISTPREQKKKRSWSIALWVFSSLLVFASRYDAFMFVLFSNFVVLVIAFKIFERFRSFYLATAAVLGSVALFLTSRVNHMVSWIFDFPLEQPPGWNKTSTWLTHYLIETPWVIIQSLGVEDLGHSLRYNQSVRLPGVVWIFGIALLGSVLIISAIRCSVEQVVFLIVSYLLLAFVVLSFNGRLDRDLFKLSGRYVLPIFSFVVGYSIYLSKSPFQLIEIRRLRTILISMLSVIHALSLYAVTETNVDGQSHSLEPIHLDSNGWWWTGFPIGPNFLVIIGTISFVWFLVHTLSMVDSLEIDVLAISKVPS